MDPKNLFSRRYGFDRPETLWDSDLPPDILEGIYGILHLTYNRIYGSGELVNRILLSQGWATVSLPHLDHLMARFKTCPWHVILSAIEFMIGELLKSGYREKEIANEMIVKFNYLFDLKHINWRFDDNGKLVRRVENIAVIEKALTETVESLATAREHLKKAWDLFNKRPIPDLPNCVKEAVSAVESAVLIVSGKEKGTLGKVLPELGLHPALSLGLEKIYAYRGDEAGVGHGKAELPDVTREEAELVLTVCAAIVTFLSQMKGKREAANNEN